MELGGIPPNPSRNLLAEAVEGEITVDPQKVAGRKTEPN